MGWAGHHHEMRERENLPRHWPTPGPQVFRPSTSTLQTTRIDTKETTKMKPRLSDLPNSNYGSTIEYHYDLAHAEGDGVVIQAIEDKLARSMSTITGAQPAPTSRQKNLSVQMFPDGSIAV